MHQSEVQSVVANAIHITEQIRRSPGSAVSFVTALLTKDPVGFMKMWTENGYYLPSTDILTGRVSLEDLLNDPEKILAVEEALKRGKVATIQLVRIMTGCGLKEGKDFVEAAPWKQTRTLYNLAQDTDELDALKGIVHVEGRVKAIQRVREMTGSGLKEAIDFVGQMMEGKNGN